MEENNKELNNKILGEIIRNYRKRKGLSLENLAKQMDITKLSIQKYEVGKRTIPFNTLLDFFRILEIPLNELEKFFKKEEKSEIREILSNLFKENKRITAIICFIDYLENLGFSFNVINSIDEENGLIYGDVEDAIRNPKVIAVRSPNKKYIFYIGIKDFLSFISLRSENNINDFINYLEVYHLDRSDTGYDDEEIERMEKIFKKVPLKKPSIFKEIIEKLNEKTKNK
ncbi:DNA-binding helix-turn-helix protein [Leptotrichia wadei]|jgi:transcriptional regulator|uniref:DNA-binding helix-turn-helix protein n=1 Tax=Leptotrichia wadei TaxID=157687 RepID=A0A510KVV4_9FUSO|nr:helix-turn-helix transcriptional regulator [Leptotrichia wadei]BBM55746.1 DNA-binding helix-turn-helix protein [Leptotrichia wadei]